MITFNEGGGEGRLSEEHLLFAVDGRTATEVAHRGLKFDDNATPLFANTRVTHPIPIMVEGEYAVLSRAQGKYQKVKLSASDIRSYAQNTPRDVAINYEHVRGGRPKGWVRLKDTMRIGTLDTREGPKTALYSALELYDEAAEDVSQGYFRDVSIELKPVSKEIIGTALTSTPVMRDLQFYSDGPLATEVTVAADAVDADTPTDDAEAAVTPDTDPQPTAESSAAEDDPPTETPSPSTQHEPKEDTVKDKTPEDAPAVDNSRETVLADALQEYGLTPDDLKALPELLRRSEFAERENRLTQARQHVTDLVSNDDGKTVLTRSGIDAAAQLLVFAQDHADEDLVFSVDGVTDEEGNARQLDIEQLFGQLFESIEAVQIFGQTPGVPADQIEPPAPADSAVDEPSYDEDRVSRIADRIKSKFRSQ